VRSNAWHWLFLVHAQHQRVVWRAQVQPHHVAQLLHEERIRGQLEALAAVGLQAKELQVALHAALGDSGFRGNRPHAPVRRTIGRLRMQSCLDQVRHPLIVDGARRPGTDAVVQTGQPMPDELARHLPTVVLWTFNLAAMDLLSSPSALRRASPHGQSRRQRATAHEGLQLRPLRRTQFQFRLGPACSHRDISVERYRTGEHD
jgi:hypothetical protein